MGIEARDLMELAKRLAANEGMEADLRSAASRSYYAAFHALLPVAALLPASCEKARGAAYVSHTELIARLADWRPSGASECLKPLEFSARKIVRKMRAARELRESA